MQDQKKYQIAIEVTADRALFADPMSKAGGEKISYQFPTYEALKGVLKGMYWKPTITWHVDAVRVMNPIRMETECTKVVKWNSKEGDLVFATYLTDVRYQVLAHYEWNMNRPEFEKDRDYKKYNAIIRRMMKAGRRSPIFLGTRECLADIVPCTFGEGDGAYDHAGTQAYGLMYHGITYADEGYDEETRKRATSNFFIPKMDDGIITFPRPEECPVHYPLYGMTMKVFDTDLPEEVLE